MWDDNIYVILCIEKRQVIKISIDRGQIIFWNKAEFFKVSVSLLVLILFRVWTVELHLSILDIKFILV